MADPVFNYVAMNPFGLSDVGYYASPTFADIDGDGDPDAFLGNGSGNTLFFRNTGTVSNPVFAAASTNPFGLNDVGNSASPTLADIDGDGDLDAFIGNSDGNTLFFRNTGTTGDPVFAAAVTNPFGLSDVGDLAKLAFVDIDGDGDLDTFVGNYGGDTLFFKNSGTASNPIFATAVTNAFGLSDVGYYASPTFADIDGDGDLDAFLGGFLGGNYNNSDGTLFYRNTGTTSNPVFYHDSMNPFGLSGVGGYRVSPAFVDIDGDSDVDVFIGNRQGNTLFFQNTGTGISPHFSGGWSGITALQGVGYNPNPTFADIDGDGDLDAFVGKGLFSYYGYYDNGAGDTLFFENTGTASEPVFAAGVTNPFGLSNVGSFASPTFVDIDEDGDLDAFVGDDAGNLQFFRNTGTASSPVFAAAITNPFGLSDIGNFATPTFVDIDSDGDLDTFVQDVFYRNTGTASNPVFAAPEVDPFGLDVWGNNLAFVDVDGDGDLDAFDSYQLFRNTGTASNPAFTYAGHPFGLYEASYGYRFGATSHTFVDIDGDGDLDVYVTEMYSYNGVSAWDGFLINNNAPNVANLTAPEVYTKNTPLNLTDIIASDPDSANITAILTLSYSAAGSLSTATSGSVTSAFNADTGVWTASGALSDVNALLAGLTFVPAFNFNGAFSISTRISDGVASPLLGSKNITLDGSVFLLSTAGNDILTGTSLNADTVTYAYAAAPVTVSLLITAQQNTIGAGLDTLISIENLVGSNFNDNLTGNALNNVLDGRAGNDILRGWDGADIMIGGPGNDSYFVENAGDVVVENLNEGTDVVSSKLTYILPVHVEGLTLTGTLAINGTGNTLDNTLTGNSAANQLNGEEGNDTLNGGAGNDILIGWSGADTMIGGSGNDSYFVENTSDIVIENFNEGTDVVSSKLTYTLPGNVENLTLTGALAIDGIGNDLDNVLIGNPAANQLNGDAGNDILNGGAGNDILIGWDGADTLIGGSGNDSYFVENTSDVVIENLNEGTDKISSSVTYTLPVNVENLTLTGALAINGTGNDLANKLIGNSAANQLTGGSGNDKLDGKAGIDTMLGGLGNDSYMVDNAGDVVTENFAEGTDKVSSKVTYTLPANVENLTLTGTLAIDGTGNDQANRITGNSGSNQLNGGAGNDTLNGGSGADTLTGGAGKDVFKFTTAGHVDTITDFIVADDTIQLENAVFTSLTTTGALAASQFRIGAKALDANDYIIYDNAAGKLLYDADGNGAGAAIQIAAIGVGLSMTNADIVVI